MRRRRTTTTGSGRRSGDLLVKSAPGMRRAAAAATALLLALLFGATSALASGDVREATELAEKTADRYEASGAYRIDFEQESYWALADSVISSRGVLIAAPPARISIEYADGGRIVASGDSIWIFVPETNQFFSSAVDSADVALDPAALLRRYEPDTSAPFVDAPEGLRTLQLRPTGAVEPARLTVTIDLTSGVVTEVEAMSFTGDRTTYTMLDTEFGVGVSPDAFAARRPEGAEIVRGELPRAP